MNQKNLIVTIPAIKYTYHCPLNFNEKIPRELTEWITEQEYTKIIHGINVLLQSIIQRSIMTSGGLLCCKTTHVMYFGTSDAVRCVNDYLNNNNKYLPEGHTLLLFANEDPPCLQYEIKSHALTRIDTTVVKKSGKVVVKHKSARIIKDEELVEKDKHSRSYSIKGEAILIPSKQQHESKPKQPEPQDNTPLLSTLHVNNDHK